MPSFYMGARDVDCLHAYVANTLLNESFPQTPKSILEIKFRVLESGLSSRLLKNLNVIVSKSRKFLLTGFIYYGII